MKKRQKFVDSEYQFVRGGVIFDVIATSQAEAVRKANASAHFFDNPIGAPGNFERVQINLRGRFSARHIVEVQTLITDVSRLTS